MCWWVFTGLVHTILDGFFVFSPIIYKDNTGSTLAEIWKEYSKADSRYALRYSDIIMLEGLFAATGPVCFLALYAIAKGKSFSTILQFAISLIALRCWKKISEACHAQDQKKNKVP
ncbi:hypothetical protein SLEP1_g41756 [Rubroshorea leprosula]|uniref:EXPERA domain-containing protein n=1 Tax=Rubroshorea leprosula TaxID=152421 RepID=A0AAV5L7J4_9ROSI|nr:hypothetical protein SLEP1_g41756 [Rubroshorea leprosula]